MTAAAVALSLFDAAPVAFDSLDMDVGNELLVAWGHRLGPCNRPFSQRAYALFVDGDPVSLAISASAVSGSVSGPWKGGDGRHRHQPDGTGPTRCSGCGATRTYFRRDQVVELARQCSAPGHAWANRVMIRIWREVFAQRWPDWPVRAAISYSQNAHHRGDLYRFDGWEKVRDDAGHPPGKTATWAKYGPDHPARGPKSLWLWRYCL